MGTITTLRKQKKFDLFVQDFHATINGEINKLWKGAPFPNRIYFYLHLYRRAHKKCQHCKILIDYVQHRKGGERLEIKPTKGNQENFKRFIKAVKSYTGEFSQRHPFFFCCESPGNKDINEEKILFKDLVKNNFVKEDYIAIQNSLWLKMWNSGKSFHFGSWTKKISNNSFIIDLFPEKITSEMENIPLIVEGYWNQINPVAVENIDHYSKTNTIEDNPIEDIEDINAEFEKQCLNCVERPLTQRELANLLQNFRKLSESGKIIRSYESEKT